MECPKCSYLRTEKDNIVPDWQCPKCGVVYSKVKTAQDKFVKVIMASGREINFNKVRLYDLALTQKLDSLRRTAAANLSGYSSGVGFWGDLEWVAAASIVTGIIENSVSNQMAKRGMGQLSEVAILAGQIRETAAYVPVSQIENIKYPDLGLWRFRQPRKPEMIHVASNYVFIETDGAESTLFWDKIEQYQLIESFEQ